MNTFITRRHRSDEMETPENAAEMAANFDRACEWAQTPPDDGTLARSFMVQLTGGPHLGLTFSGAALHCQACRAVSPLFIPHDDDDFRLTCEGWRVLRSSCPDGLVRVLCPICDAENPTP